VSVNGAEPGPGLLNVGAAIVTEKVPSAPTATEAEAPVAATITVSPGVKPDPVTPIGAPSLGRAFTKQAPLSVTEGAADARTAPTAIEVNSTAVGMYQAGPIVRF
jgi:hypothetical protein